MKPAIEYWLFQRPHIRLYVISYNSQDKLKKLQSLKLIVKKTDKVNNVREAIIIMGPYCAFIICLLLAGCNRGTFEVRLQPGHSVTNLELPLSVESTYPTNDNWMDFVKRDDHLIGDAADPFKNWHAQDDVSCDGTETGIHSACIHGGEKRKITIPGFTNCNGISATDELSAFNWTCVVLSGAATVVMEGLKETKGLKDLITADGEDWRSNRVTVMLDGRITVGVTPKTVWWNNPVELLPVNDTVAITGLNSGTVYTVPNDETTRNINMTGVDKLAIVTLNDSTLRSSPSTPGGEHFLRLENSKFHYIEGYFDGELRGQNAIMLMNVFFSRIIGVKVHNPGDYDCIGIDSSNRNYFRNILCSITSNVSDGAFPLLNIHYNVFSKVTVSNIGDYSIFYSHGVTSSHNIYTEVIAPNRALYAENGASQNNSTFSHVTSLNSYDQAFNFGSSDGVTLNQALIINPGNNGVQFNSGNADANGKFSQIAIDRIDSGSSNDFNLSDSSPFTFHGNLFFDTAASCTATGGAPGIDASCVATGASTSSTHLGKHTHQSIVGKLTSDDLDNTESGPSDLFTNISDWTNFENFFRFWGIDGSAFPHSNNRAPCRTGDTCRIWDARISSSDTHILNRSGNGVGANEAFVAGLTCPSAVNGNRAITDSATPTNTFLMNAVEVHQDSLGDDDGLCESYEACIYSPHIGAYQGEGDFKTSGTCSFQDGTVQGVKMYAYPIDSV